MTTPGAVIDGVEVHGVLTVKAPNVVIKNSRILGRAVDNHIGLVNNIVSGAPFTIQDSEITAAIPSAWQNGIFGSRFTAIRVDIHGVIDPIKVIGDDVEVRDSWLHDNLHYEQDESPWRDAEPRRLDPDRGRQEHLDHREPHGGRRQRGDPDHAEHVQDAARQHPHQRQLLQRRRLHREHRADAGVRSATSS